MNNKYLKAITFLSLMTELHKTFLKHKHIFVINLVLHRYLNNLIKKKIRILATIGSKYISKFN